MSDEAGKLGYCPFCFNREGIRLVHIPEGNPWVFFYGCPRCESNGPVARTPEGAALAWNTRSMPTGQDLETLGKGARAQEIPALLVSGWVSSGPAGA